MIGRQILPKLKRSCSGCIRPNIRRVVRLQEREPRALLPSLLRKVIDRLREQRDRILVIAIGVGPVCCLQAPIMGNEDPRVRSGIKALQLAQGRLGGHGILVDGSVLERRIREWVVVLWCAVCFERRGKSGGDRLRERDPRRGSNQCRVVLGVTSEEDEGRGLSRHTNEGHEIAFNVLYMMISSNSRIS
jgi:hypothetical protein